MPSRRRAFALALVAGASCWSTASWAQSLPTAPEAPAATPAPEASATTEPAAEVASPAPGDTIRLTDRQRREILDGNTVEKAAAARGELTGSGLAGLGIHGEVGAMIGTNGMRAVYGTAEIPLGDNAGAVVSFESSHYGYSNRR